MRRVGYFGEVLNSVVYALVEQAEIIEKVHIAILTCDPHIYKKGSSEIVCTKLGSSCNPACRLFDPLSVCRFSDLSLNYQTFYQAYWSYRVIANNKNDDWRLFYECFHGKPKPKGVTGLFKAEFPYDIPFLNNQQVMSNQSVSKNLSPDDPSFWDDDRVRKATSGDDLERRLACTDWDWKWYNSLTKKGVKVDMTMAQNKNKFDKLMFAEFGETYEDTGVYFYKKGSPNFINLSGLYERLKDNITVRLEFVDKKES